MESNVSTQPSSPKELEKVGIELPNLHVLGEVD